MVIKLAWTMPARNYGVGTAMWLWAVFLAVITTVSTVSGGAFAELPIVFMLWIVVVGWWFLLRWLARRRYRPQDLPARRVRIRR